MFCPGWGGARDGPRSPERAQADRPLGALRTHSGSAYRDSNAVAQITIKPPGFDDLPSRVQVPSSLLQLSSSFQELLFRTHAAYRL
jgi:hypothetical protein